MALRVQCQCGSSYSLKDEYAGQLVRCPKCQAVSRADRALYTPASQADPVFDRDVFLFAPKPRGVNDAYVVSDERGAAIVLVERSEPLLRGLLALAAGVAVMFLLLGVVVRYATALGRGAGPNALVIVGGLVALLIPHVARGAFVPKRHVVLHRNGRKRERVLEIVEDRGLQLVVGTYTVCDAAGEPIARLRKNHLLNAFRRRWEVRTLADHVAFVATEDSLFDALRCRVIGSFYRLSRTKVVIHAPDGRRALGEFKGHTTTFDRYVLDLNRDRHRKLDRRVALALGVMLDIGEERR
ncbi:MAG: hypothetical protein ABR499_12360 [Gemmatimonadaceae bacterium]